MHKLIGQEKAKVFLEQLIAKSKIDRFKEENSLSTQPIMLHSFFVGEPGTGKTTFARQLGLTLKETGLLSSGHIIETHRSDFVGSYQGETENKTENIIERALGGILFIDEAYSLYQGPQDTYGRHVINILTKRMEDFRNEFIVILAGYPDEMKKLMQSNSGFSRRIMNIIEFENLNLSQLNRLFKNMCMENTWTLTVEAENHILKEIEHDYQNGHLNAGVVKNKIERIQLQQNLRLFRKGKLKTKDLYEIVKSDVTEDPLD